MSDRRKNKILNKRKRRGRATNFCSFLGESDREGGKGGDRSTFGLLE